VASHFPHFGSVCVLATHEAIWVLDVKSSFASAVT
jgi:hypothetical protein